MCYILIFSHKNTLIGSFGDFCLSQKCMFNKTSYLKKSLFFIHFVNQTNNDRWLQPQSVCFVILLFITTFVEGNKKTSRGATVRNMCLHADW